MNIDKLFKKRLVFFVTSTVFIVIVTIASSYAFLHSELNNDIVVFNNNKLQVLYENGQIVEDESYPMSLQQGMKETIANTIKVINNTKMSTNFSLKITDKEENKNSLGHDKIYFSINGSEPMLLSTATDGIVFYGKVNGDEEYILNIKVWPALEYISNDDQGKGVNLKFDIIE